jgi:hypothetical protein
MPTGDWPLNIDSGYIPYTPQYSMTASPYSAAGTSQSWIQRMQVVVENNDVDFLREQVNRALGVSVQAPATVSYIPATAGLGSVYNNHNRKVSKCVDIARKICPPNYTSAGIEHVSSALMQIPEYEIDTIFQHLQLGDLKQSQHTQICKKANRYSIALRKKC